MPKASERREIPAIAVESLWHAGDGHPVRRIDWPAAQGGAKGSILFVQGRADFYEKYLDVMAHWHAAGWRVTGSDWRGQGGSGRLGADAVTGHIDDYSIWIDDLALLWARWKAETPGPHILVGHSMGGHLVLRAAAEGRVDPDGIILAAPMLGFAASVLPVPLMHLIAKVMTRTGDKRRPAWKWSDEPGVPPDSRAGLLTHDAERYQDELFWRAKRPELVTGPGSWGWVERGYASMRQLAAPGVLEAIRIPVLMLAADNDKLVAFGPIAKAAARLPNCELVRFGKESHHEILREADGVRGRALAACDAFMARVAAG